MLDGRHKAAVFSDCFRQLAGGRYLVEVPNAVEAK